MNCVDFIVCSNHDKESERGQIFFSAIDKMVRIAKSNMVIYIKIHLDHVFKCFMTFNSFFVVYFRTESLQSGYGAIKFHRPNHTMRLKVYEIAQSVTMECVNFCGILPGYPIFFIWFSGADRFNE